MKYILFIMLFIPSLVFGQHISLFTSLNGGNQDKDLHLPTTHSFQYIIETGDPLTEGGTLPDRCDYAGYVPISGSSTNGYLSINSEETPGGVTVLDIMFDLTQKKWIITDSEALNFSSVGGTRENCGGGIMSNGNVLSCQETLGGGLDGNGYKKFGWAVEIDPVTKTVLGERYKLGNFKHENAAIAPNQRTIYQGEDDPTGNLYKFVSDNPNDLTSGNLYALNLTGPNYGQWMLLSNSTPSECNSSKSQASGFTQWPGIEDVEISPIDGKIYFAVKGDGKIYRFNDNNALTGGTISNFETYVGGMSYDGEAWGQGNDNLAFDNIGNLWVCQDGSKNHVWVVGVNHNQANPDVRIFAKTPDGCEPTGITFTPDYKFLFLSIMHPNASNGSSTVNDAFGNPKKFDEDVVLVISRNEFLGGIPVFPIRWGEVSATKSGNSILITWEMLDDLPEYFIIEKRINNTWNKIGSIGGTNTHITDKNPAQGENTYRVKAIDIDGLASYSNVVSEIFESYGLSIYPNPSNGVIFIHSDGRYKIVDITGRIFSYVEKGYNRIELLSGIYFLNGKIIIIY